jgi:uncharacterized protein (TIGR02391 family)
VNLETILPQGMWEAIRINYEKRDFTSAILDCCYFISELLRQRSGVDGDGVPLVGQVLGGPHPKIRIAKDQSITELDKQKGIESILRGFYQAIRNPRTHKKINDSADDAICILMFCGYIVKQVEQARAPASKEALISRILDKDFVPEERYAELLTKEIPTGMRMEVFLGVYEQKSDWNISSVKLYNKVAMNQMSLEERASIIDLISEDLKTVEDDAIIRPILGGFEPEIWAEISEVARLRIEHRIIRSIADGRYDRTAKRCAGGALATWACGHVKFFLSQRRLASALYSKLNSINSQERDYALQYFVDTLGGLSSEHRRSIDSLFVRELKAGSEPFHDSLLFSPWDERAWSDSLKEAYKNFSAKVGSSDETDEIPF